ncbi:hypothetical protein QAD02_010286 [Eretmocerus hayati]|uniref:Uncharacterized protein n=1 Tax=Eretmocerus hayati TaxID=131215 RepID=A0ACC2NCE6_9HYME|nr:hypothetical protein QAD02_010286 [Eretmocerus hayati]
MAVIALFSTVFAVPVEEMDDCADRCFAPLMLSPVCGDDGIKYSNFGYFKCAQMCNPAITSYSLLISAAPPKTRKPSKGPCDPDCLFPKIYIPVCGSDGKTYPHPNVLKCERKCNPSLKEIADISCEDLFADNQSRIIFGL